MIDGQAQLRQIAAIIFLAVSNVAAAVEPIWLPTQTNDVDLTVDGPTITVRTTGSDPFLVWRWKQPLDADQQVLEFEYFGTREIKNMHGYHGPPISESTRFSLPRLTIAEGWQTYKVDLLSVLGRRLPPETRALRIDFGMNSDLQFQIRGVNLRRRTSVEIRQAAEASKRRAQKVSDSESIRQYLKSDFPGKFDEILVDEQSITLAGTVESEYRDLKLFEYPASQSVSRGGIALNDVVERNGQTFKVQLPRQAVNRDRLHSGWRIQATNTTGEARVFVTARHHPTSITTVGEHPSDRLRPKSQKGLSGISRRGPMNDFIDLGIHGVTLNLVLSRFVSTTPGKTRERIDVPGSPVYFDSAAFHGYDELIDFARRHEMVVSAIVLIPRARRGPPSPLAHPESDGGVYVMPDLTSVRGAAIYAFVLDRIARRYRNTDQEPGGITNWIAHNEIDFHPVWTNMGRQPRELVTEVYYRSMRMIHNAARAHNPHARVFVSLTHHWVVPDDGSWKQLAPREVLETLDRYSELEGSLAWGVAYHPYPQSLFAPVAWKDTNISDDFDTPLITIQNLEVLGRFLAQPEMRDQKGAVRPVLLSEQGFHTESYEPEAQGRQAGSLWYAMKKVQSMPWIESFHYHRWIDHPDEGGLMLGLRTLPTPEDRHGKPKRSWDVYRAIGTDAEERVTQGLPQP